MYRDCTLFKCHPSSQGAIPNFFHASAVSMYMAAAGESACCTALSVVPSPHKMQLHMCCSCLARQRAGQPRKFCVTAKTAAPSVFFVFLFFYCSFFSGVCRPRHFGWLCPLFALRAATVFVFVRAHTGEGTDSSIEVCTTSSRRKGSASPCLDIERATYQV